MVLKFQETKKEKRIWTDEKNMSNVLFDLSKKSQKSLTFDGTIFREKFQYTEIERAYPKIEKKWA